MKIAVLTEQINSKSGSRAPLEIAKSLSSSLSLREKTKNKVAVFAYATNQEKITSKNIDFKIFEDKNLITIFKVVRKLKKGRFDIISFHGTLPFFLGAVLSGIPIVRTYYGTQFDAYLEGIFPEKPNYLHKIINKIFNFAIYLQEKFMLALSSKVIAISKYTQKELERLYNVKSDFIYLGSPSLVTRHKSLGTSKQIRILSVSRIVPYKGFHTLINVFKQLNAIYPDIKLTIAGSSPNPKYLKYLKEIANKNVKFLINLPDYALQTTYYRSHIYITADRYLFFGMPVLEAQSAGLPCLALNFAAAGEVINDKKTGYVADNEEEFEKYLQKLIDSPRLRIKMGKAGKAWAKSFNWKKTGSDYEKIFLRFGNK